MPFVLICKICNCIAKHYNCNFLYTSVEVECLITNLESSFLLNSETANSRGTITSYVKQKALKKDQLERSKRIFLHVIALICQRDRKT